MMVHQDKVTEREYYDRLFSSRKAFDQFRDNELYKLVAGRARGATDGNVAMDLGCGSGTLAVCLMQEGFSVVSADLSLEAARLCRRNASSSERFIGVISADAESLPLPAASVDACVCSLLLHHFKSVETVAAELQRVVRPGGVVVATDANGHNPFAWLFFNVIHRMRPIPWLTPNQRAITSRELVDVFTAHGFGNFQFSSYSTALRRDWLGKSWAFTLNFRARQLLLAMSNVALPPLSRGNVLLSSFQRSNDQLPPESRPGTAAGRMT
jgi:SAM-dependent methyltransferase